MGAGVSLHIGVNSVDPIHYGGWAGPLAACENDATDMEDLAHALGYSTTLLLTAQAARDAIILQIKAAASGLAPGDTFLLSYAGHGGQVPDTSGDEPDGFDETWCLYDGQLLDDELFALWQSFLPGVRIIVVSDSCHSGSATRAPMVVSREAVTSTPTAEAMGFAGAAYRYMPRDRALRTMRLNRDFYRDLQTSTATAETAPTPVRLLSGCQDNQFSLDGDVNGLFTSVLLEVWDGGTFAGDYSTFHRDILSLMPSTQSPNHLLLGPNDPDFDAERPFTS